MMLPVTGSVLLLMFLYFIQGLPYGLQAQFLPVYLRSKGVDLTDIGLLKIVYAPWLCKFLWGPLVDQLSTKRKWLLVSILCLGGTCIFGAFFPPDFLIPVIIVLFLLNLFASIQDVAVDAIAIRLLTSDELGQGNTVQVVGYKLGSIFGGGILASFVHVIGWMGLFLVLAVLYVEAAMFIYVSPSLRNLDVYHRPSSRAKNEEEPTHEKGNNFDSSCSDEVHGTDAETLCEYDQFIEDAVGNCVAEVADSRELKHMKQSRHSCNSDAFVHSSKSTSRMCSHCVDSKPEARDHLDTLERAAPGTESEEVDAHRFHNTFRQVLNVPGTRWMMSFLLLFKLGEQGALNMLPLFFLDKKVEPSEVTFWTGVVGQGVSICGSVLGGWFVTVYRKIPLDFMLQQLCLLRLLPVGAQLLLVVIWDVGHLYREALFYVAIVMLLLLLLLSGIITTVTFTFMMQCSRSATVDIQATHYTTLATFEVLGKLAFTAACGWFADVFGYRFLFLSFAALSVIVLPLLKACPEDITCLESASDSSAELEVSDARDKAE